MTRFLINESNLDYSMKCLYLVIAMVFCLSFSTPALCSEDKDSLELPEEIKNLTSDQILVPRPPIVPIYPLRAKKDGVNAEVWVRYKILQGKMDSAKVIFCSKNGYNLENAAFMSLKEHDFSKDSNAVNSENKWLYTKVTFGYGVHYPTVRVPIESEYAEVVERMPEFIKKGMPEYPSKARNEGITARIWVRVLVNKAGIPVKVVIAESSDSANVYGFNDVVLRAAKMCRFKPAIQNGKPVNVWISFPYEFTLNR